MDRVFRFAATTPDAALLYQGHYDPRLVVLSVALAVFAAYTALLTTTVGAPSRTGQYRPQGGLLTLGGITMGIGTWAMHFIGMLGFHIQGRMEYDPWLTGLSVVPSVVASVVAMRLVARPQPGARAVLTAGTILGSGIGLMHYTGMAAMEIDGQIVYAPARFWASILVAVALAVAAL